MELKINVKKSIIISFFMLLSFAEATSRFLLIQTQLPIKNDPVSALEIAINVTIEQTTLAISTAGKIANASNTPAETVSNLGDCLQNYQDALDNLQSAQGAILRKDIGTINSMLSAAVSYYVTCNDEFIGSNPVADYSNKLKNMTSNCLVIASQIK